MGLFVYTQKGSIISMVDLPTTEIIEPHFTTLFIGMDVHKESFSLCYYDMMANQFKHSTKVGPNVSYIV
ncbi:hypothetical protein ACTGUT_12190, partial [Streptococcus suis]